MVNVKSYFKVKDSKKEPITIDDWNKIVKPIEELQNKFMP
jgi:hypothetical protein